MKSTTEAAVQKANRELLAAIRKLPQQPLVVVAVLGAFSFLGTFLLLSSRAAAPGDQAAYFALDYPPYTKPFVIELRDPARIQQARAFVSNKWTVSGTIVKQQANYNRDWSFYLDPASIEFTENPGESCDADLQFVQDNLPAVGRDVLPDNRWCPAEAEGLREVSR